MTQTAEPVISPAPQSRAPLIREITLRNFLSFGPETEPLALRPLNVLIGPNGSGKSNLIEAVGVLRATPGDLRKVIRRGGGVSEWIWKGNPEGAAGIRTLIQGPSNNRLLRHTLCFAAEGRSFELTEETIEEGAALEGKRFRPFIYRLEGGQAQSATAPIGTATSPMKIWKLTVRFSRRSSIRVTTRKLPSLPDSIRSSACFGNGLLAGTPSSASRSLQMFAMTGWKRTFPISEWFSTDWNGSRPSGAIFSSISVIFTTGSTISG